MEAGGGRPRTRGHAAGGSTPDTRERLVEAARDLFWARGYEATAVSDILDRADVHSGSLYHHFRGKQDLLLAVLDRYVELLWPVVIAPAFRKTDDPLEQVFAVLEGYRRGLLASGFAGGCPIGNLALEVSDTDPEARERIARNFEGWKGWIRDCLERAGDRLGPGADPGVLSDFVLAVMEGGVMQARAYRSIEPFDAAVAQLRDYIERLEDAAPRTGREDEPGAGGGAPAAEDA